MGCGASSGGLVNGDDILDTSSLKESSRRRKNNAQKHAALLNIIDESLDASRSFKTYAIQMRQPWDDWRNFALSEDNQDDVTLREVTEVLQSQFSAEQANEDMQVVRMRNEYIAILKDLLNKFKMYDDHVQAAETAERDREKALQEAEKAQQRIDQARAKPNYDLVQAKLEGTLEERKARCTACEERVRFTRTICQEQGEALKKTKKEFVVHALKTLNLGYIRYHTESLAVAQKFTHALERLEGGPSQVSPLASHTLSSSSILPPPSTLSREETQG